MLKPNSESLAHQYTKCVNTPALPATHERIRVLWARTLYLIENKRHHLPFQHKLVPTENRLGIFSARRCYLAGLYILPPRKSNKQATLNQFGKIVNIFGIVCHAMLKQTLPVFMKHQQDLSRNVMQRLQGQCVCEGVDVQHLGIRTRWDARNGVIHTHIGVLPPYHSQKRTKLALTTSKVLHNVIHTLQLKINIVHNQYMQ